MNKEAKKAMLKTFAILKEKLEDYTTNPPIGGRHYIVVCTNSNSPLELVHVNGDKWKPDFSSVTEPKSYGITKCQAIVECWSQPCEMLEVVEYFKKAVENYQEIIDFFFDKN